jgi:hypothetical protein
MCGFQELYLYADDPSELTNAASQRPAIKREMKAAARAACSPPPPDFSW